jgi:hypothetical protein
LALLSVLGALFIPRPWLVVIPTLLFAGLYRSSHRKLAGAAALIWLLYGLYEYAMYQRWLCTGECNIRVDLLLIYPVIVLVSIAAAVVAIGAILRRPVKGTTP